ncbi:hypothetical protein ABH920_004214 [Catenulispora sp. EB89]|uniref:hypothetical protein n=1 Tax=Catenulispora sp. EB89 TaxID=3156257 RepID=UPI003510DC82
MGMWKARRRRAAYSRLVAQVSGHDVVWAAEEIVGGAWMAGLTEAERQAGARHASGSGCSERDSKLREFIERERVVWEQAERIRTLEILEDRDRLAAAARAIADTGKAGAVRAAVREAEQLGEESRLRLAHEIRDIPLH